MGDVLPGFEGVETGDTVFDADRGPEGLEEVIGEAAAPAFEGNSDDAGVGRAGELVMGDSRPERGDLSFDVGCDDPGALGDRDDITGDSNGVSRGVAGVVGLDNVENAEGSGGAYLASSC